MNAIQHTSTHGPHTLAPAAGVTPPDPGATPHRFLSDALVARGLVSQEQMDAALDASRAGQRYSEILVIEGTITEDDLALTLAGHHRIDHVDLDVFPIEAEATALVPRETARRLGALPIAILPHGGVVVAVHDPEALTRLGELGTLIRRDVRPVVASRSQVDRHLAAPGSPVTVPAPAAPAAVPAPAVEPPPALVLAPEPVAVAEPAPAVPVATPPAIEPQLTGPGGAGEDAPAAEPAAIAPDGVRPLTPEPSSRLPEDCGARGTDPHDPSERAVAAGAEGPAATGPQLEQTLADADAERRVAEAEARAAAAEREARFADERARAAEKHAEGMSAAAQAANDALAQLAQARLVSDQAAQAAALKIETLSSELEAERAERRRLAEQLQLRSEPAAAPAPAPASAPAPAPVVVLPAAPPAAPPPPPPAPRASVPGPPPLRPVPALAAEVGPVTDRQRKARGLRRMIAALRRS